MLIFGLCGICGSSGGGNNKYDPDKFDPASENYTTCDDIECSKEKLTECERSYSTFEGDFTIVQVVKGRTDDDKCEVYYKLVDIDDDILPEGYGQIAGLLKGSDATCYLEDKDLKRIKEYTEGKVDEDTMKLEIKQLLSQKCEGSLADYMNLLIR